MLHILLLNSTQDLTLRRNTECSLISLFFLQWNLYKLHIYVKTLTRSPDIFLFFFSSWTNTSVRWTCECINAIDPLVWQRQLTLSGWCSCSPSHQTAADQRCLTADSVSPLLKTHVWIMTDGCQSAITWSANRRSGQREFPCWHNDPSWSWTFNSVLRSSSLQGVISPYASHFDFNSLPGWSLLRVSLLH